MVRPWRFEGLEDLERIVGHRFRDRSLLERAVTHSSAAADGEAPAPADNERLEFLGDAVLGMVVSDYLLAAFPDWSEGRLSRGRARLVKSASLTAAAQRLGLGEHMRLGRGEEKSGGRQKPALLANAFEAVVAAVYLDGGLAPAREFVERSLLAPALVHTRRVAGPWRRQVRIAGVAAEERLAGGAVQRAPRKRPGSSQDVPGGGLRGRTRDRHRLRLEQERSRAIGRAAGPRAASRRADRARS